MWAGETAGVDPRELARRATVIARARMPEADIEILWDGLWIRRMGPHYFPDPDLLPLQISDDWIERVRQLLPELPEAMRTRLAGQYGLGGYDAARFVHFFAMGTVVGFLAVHITLAILVPKSLRAMIIGR